MGGLKAPVARANFGSRASNSTTRGWPLGPSNHMRVTFGLKSDGKMHVGGDYAHTNVDMSVTDSVRYTTRLTTRLTLVVIT
jgi:hypothetical protein